MKPHISISSILFSGFLASSAVAVAQAPVETVAQVPVENRWEIGVAVMSHGPDGSFDEISVKDPSIVFYEGMWHLFYTARSKEEYTIGYAGAENLTDLNSASRHELEMIRGETRYGAAPQILYFEPQQQWYLIFQTRDEYYQPAFSTTKTISDPTSWSHPEPLLQKDSEEKWIDFWIISDEAKAYLFYTEGHNKIIVRSTDLESFPDGWSDGKEVFRDVHEAVHIYKVQGRNEFHMIYELNHDGIRSFGLAAAEKLSGPWEKITDRYATGDQLQFVGETRQWTDMVSHGEAIRAGCDQRMKYDPDNVRWLIQGLPEKNLEGPYKLLPWRLGIMSKKQDR